MYQERKGRKFCEVIPAGYVGETLPEDFQFINDVRGHNNIYACPTGHYCMGGERGEVPCPLGSSQFLEGQSSCNLCQSHQYQDQNGQTKCNSIEQGWHCSD